MTDLLASNSTNASKGPDPNWLFCLDYQGSKIFWAVLLTSCACVGVPAALWLLWVLIQKQHHQQQRSGTGSSSSSNNNNNVFLLNLTVMDLICNATLPICVLNNFLWLNHRVVSVTLFSYNLNTVGRPLITICVCADCYLAVVHPIVYMKAKLDRWRLMACVLFWVVPCTAGIAVLDNNQMPSSPVAIVPFLVSLPPIVFFNASILRVLQRPDPAGRSGVHPQKQRAMRTIRHSLVAATMAYLPPLLGFSLYRLLPLTKEQLVCLIAVPITTPTLMLSALMPMLHLKSLGRLSHVTGACRCE